MPGKSGRPVPFSGKIGVSPFWKWFSLSEPVGRRFYALSGFGLVIFKYLVDCLIVWFVTGNIWTPLGYLHPSLAARQNAVGSPPQWVFWTLLVWTLPFYWIGISMTVRRAIDAGIGSGWALLFFEIGRAHV